VITYEYPLNERIRTLMRLENLFGRANHFLVNEEDSRDHHAALLTLFEILEVASRADLKSDLLRGWSARSRSCSASATTRRSPRTSSNR
jgi:cell division protein ZapD